jgi:two-component SAPR family response regulator
MAIGGEELYAHGRLETLERWFQIMPLECLDTPLLCLKAKILVDRGHAPEAQILVDLARARMHPDQEPAVLLLQAKLERITGNYETALATARRAYEQSRDPSQQATALCLIANCQFRLGSDIGDAIEHLHRALEIERQRGDLYALAMIQHDLGMCYEAMGMLSEAETCYVNGSAAWSTLGNQGRQAMVLNSTGVVQHMRGRYHEAHATLRTALQKAQDSGVPAYVAAILTSLGDLYSDLELWEQAHTAYHDAQQQGGSAFIRSYLELAVIRLSLRQHQPRAAALALKQISPTTQQRQNAQIMLLHGMLACLQRDYAQAIAIARQVIAEAAPDTLREIAQAHLCYAWGIAGATPTETTELLAALERAAQIGTQLGNDTFLIVETLPMRAVLRQAAAAGWPHATEWLTRQQDLRLLAQFLTRTDERPVFVVRTLGADQITLNGQPIDIGWQKAREVLYYLLAHPNGSAADTLREEIWPDLPPQRSRDALKTAIYKLRAVLPQGLIVSQGRQIYRLDLETVYLDYDVMQFLATLETYRDNDEALFDALDLYRGAYLPWSDNPWSSAIRTALEQRYLQILRLMATRRFSHRAYLDALALYQRLLAVDNLDEAAHSGVMRCFIALGYRAAAIEQYRTLCRLIQDELGLDIDRDSEAERLYHQIIAAP